LFNAHGVVVLNVVVGSSDVVVCTTVVVSPSVVVGGAVVCSVVVATPDVVFSVVVVITTLAVIIVNFRSNDMITFRTKCGRVKYFHCDSTCCCGWDVYCLFIGCHGYSFYTYSTAEVSKNICNAFITFTHSANYWHFYHFNVSKFNRSLKWLA